MEGYIKPDVAANAIKTHGTPVRLLKLFYESLGCRLVLFQRSTCRYVHIPDDWSTRPWNEKDTVVLNIWSNHVFTYNNSVNDIPFHPKEPFHAEFQLASLKPREDRFDFKTMKPFSWADLAVAVQEKANGTIFYITQFLDHSFFDGLEDHNYTFCPSWKTPENAVP